MVILDLISQNFGNNVLIPFLFFEGNDINMYENKINIKKLEKMKY